MSFNAFRTIVLLHYNVGTLVLQNKQIFIILVCFVCFFVTLLLCCKLCYWFGGGLKKISKASLCN